MQILFRLIETILGIGLLGLALFCGKPFLGMALFIGFDVMAIILVPITVCREKE